MAALCRFMLLPPELRLSIYRKVFHNFVLQIADEEHFTAYGIHPDIAPNQLCKVSKQVRLESTPVLASCTNVIAAPLLLPYKDGHVDTSVKAEVVRPRLNRLFTSNIQAISVSLQSAWVPDHCQFRNLKKIVVDAWLFGEEPIEVKKDKDLVEMATLDLVRLGVQDDIYPVWLEQFIEEKSLSVKLALRQVWKVDENDSESSYLKALVNVTDEKIEERHLGSKTFEEVDIVPPAWLFG